MKRKLSPPPYKMNVYLVYRRICADLGKNPLSEKEFKNIAVEQQETVFVDALRLLGTDVCKKVIEETAESGKKQTRPLTRTSSERR